METRNHNRSIFWERGQSESSQVESCNGKKHLERAILHIYPLQLSCETTAPSQEHMMNVEAE